MLWIIFAIIAYFLLAISAVIDDFLLTGPLAKPKLYAFYVSILGIFVFVLAPFGFVLPDTITLLIALLSGALWFFGLLGLFESLRLFEASRVIPAIGGILPIFTLIFSYIFALQSRETITSLSAGKILAFVFLITGSVLISLEKNNRITKKSFILSGLTALLFALSFFTTKLVYISQPFISGLIWIKVGGFLVALLFLFSKEIRKEIFKKRQKKTLSPHKKPRVILLFLFNQLIGVGSGILQNLAIFLAPISYLAFINAAEGVRYVFLLILTVLLSYKFPRFLSDKISKQVVFQKAFAILFIITGLILLTI
ncbi:MAG: GRP family sugar transporter [Candidatus Parcubacteria bacterium]|nr:GRP family sugar transporter [Candidatus Parcubacteria bacterium]